MSTQRNLALLITVLTAACGEPVMAEDVPALVVGSYGVSYAVADDAAQLDDFTVQAVDALQAIFTDVDLTPVWRQITVEVTDLPEGVDGTASAKGFAIHVERHPCPGQGSLAHELAHIARREALGDGDGAHQDTRLFMGACKTNACVWASVEMVGRPTCKERGQ